MSLCRSCRRDILWAFSDADKPMPVDAKPVKGGTIVLLHLEEQGRPPIAHVTTDEERAELERQHANLVRKGVVPKRPFKLFVSHFATCPQAGQWRRA